MIHSCINRRNPHVVHDTGLTTEEKKGARSDLVRHQQCTSSERLVVEEYKGMSSTSGIIIYALGTDNNINIG